MNKDGKIKGKFNVIDILVVFLFVAVIAGIAVRFGVSVTSEVENDAEFEYVVRVESVRQYTVDALNKKGFITDYKAENTLGEIISVETEPAKFLSEKSNGEMVYASQPDRYIAYVTIKAKGKEAEDSYISADKNELSVGRVVEIISKYVHTSGKIVSVKKCD